jgi:hypothetical protein
MYLFLIIGHNGKLYAPCGIFEDAFSSPATNFAKADNQKRCKPARMVYYSMLYAGCVP